MRTDLHKQLLDKYEYVFIELIKEVITRVNNHEIIIHEDVIKSIIDKYALRSSYDNKEIFEEIKYIIKLLEEIRKG